MVGRTELDGSFDFRVLEYALPSGIGERAGGAEVNVELRSDTWVPSLTGGTDGRTLGVMVDWMEVASADGR